ncbi:hypothetical protein DH2020_004449 [Rehmannia glutinosa]|uniref:HMA domain-containing protein n=1 Tax=Rehmannia glutinosa TaxID=99300 RepID=A0ABR0XPR6_REHGL
MIEGDALGDKLESIAYEIKFEPSDNGGCICKFISEYYGVGGHEVEEEEIKAGKESALGIFKVVEAYLSENPHSLMMVPEMEKPRVTEIKVRMDCNGCVQKIKKALHGITGIYDIYIDFPQQKITIIGWADPEVIIKAIKKTRKRAIICLHTEQQSDEPAQPTEPTPEGGEAPPPEPTTQPPEPTQTEATSPAEPPPENPPPEPMTSSESANATTTQSEQPSKPKEPEEIHVVHHHPPDYGYRYYAYGPNFQQGYNGQFNAYHGGPGFREEPPQPPQPVYVTHSYNTYKPSPYVTEYAYPVHHQMHIPVTTKAQLTLRLEKEELLMP